MPFTIIHKHTVCFQDGEGVSLVKTIRDLFLGLEKHMSQLFDDLNAKIDAEHAEVKTLIQAALDKATAKDKMIADLKAQLDAAGANTLSDTEKSALMDRINSFSDDVSVMDPSSPTTTTDVPPAP